MGSLFESFTALAGTESLTKRQLSCTVVTWDPVVQRCVCDPERVPYQGSQYTSECYYISGVLP